MQYLSNIIKQQALVGGHRAKLFGVVSRVGGHRTYLFEMVYRVGGCAAWLSEVVSWVVGWGAWVGFCILICVFICDFYLPCIGKCYCVPPHFNLYHLISRSYTIIMQICQTICIVMYIVTSDRSVQMLFVEIQKDRNN